MTEPTEPVFAISLTQTVKLKPAVEPGRVAARQPRMT